MCQKQEICTHENITGLVHSGLAVDTKIRATQLSLFYIYADGKVGHVQGVESNTRCSRFKYYGSVHRTLICIANNVRGAVLSEKYISTKNN